MEDTTSTSTTVAADPKLVNWTKLIYALHAVSILIGIIGTATIIGSFVFGVPSIVAVIMNYLKRDEAKGTWLESHFNWQIRTFWIALVVFLALWLVFGTLSLILIGIPFLILGLVLLGIWAIYRVVRGWMALADNKPLPG